MALAVYISLPAPSVTERPVTRSTAAAEYPPGEPNSCSSEASIPAGEVSWGIERLADGVGVGDGVGSADEVAKDDAGEAEEDVGRGAATSLCLGEGDEPAAVLARWDSPLVMLRAASVSATAPMTSAATELRLRIIMITILSGRAVPRWCKRCASTVRQMSARIVSP